LQTSIEGRYKEPVDKARSWRRVGKCGNNRKLICIRHNHALDRVVVIGGPPQHGGAWLNSYYPGKRAWLARNITGETDAIADNDATTAKLARFHSRDHAITGPASVTAAIDAGHKGIECI